MQINQIVAMVPTQEQRIFLELWLPTTTQYYLLSALWAQSKRRLLLLLPQYSFSTSHKAQLISCLHLIKVVFHCYVCTSVRDEWVWCTYLLTCLQRIDYFDPYCMFNSHIGDSNHRRKSLVDVSQQIKLPSFSSA